jgi:heme/copper-type cytochrome/quinol oxidase subunit 3
MDLLARRPLRMEMIGHKKLGMYLFIASDAMTFGALVIAYLYVRSAVPPTSFSAGLLMTLLLLSSSITMLNAVKAAKRGSTGTATRYLFLTIVGGLGFLTLHLSEWRGLIEQGFHLNQSPFFTLTGFHMAHVAAGVLYLAFTTQRCMAARCTLENLEVSGIYWYFVDVVWIFLLALFYL